MQTPFSPLAHSRHARAAARALAASAACAVLLALLATPLHATAPGTGPQVIAAAAHPAPDARPPA